ASYWIHDMRYRRSVSSFVRPCLEVHDLRSTNRQQNAQNLQAGCSLCQLRIKTSTALLDRCEVKARSVSNRLQEISKLPPIIRAGNRWMLPHCESRDSLRQYIAEILILSTAAITRVPRRIHSKLHQVGEAPDLLRTGSFAAGKRAELFEVHRFGTL